MFCQPLILYAHDISEKDENRHTSIRPELQPHNSVSLERCVGYCVIRKIARVTRAGRRRMAELMEETGRHRSLTERLVRSIIITLGRTRIKDGG